MKSLIIYVLIGVVAYMFFTTAQAERNDIGTIVDGGNIDAFQIQFGDCFNDNNAILDQQQEITDVPGVPCSSPHDNEVYAVFDTEFKTYPGDEVMWDTAFNACMEKFAGFVGRDYETSSLDILTLYPTKYSWEVDDREVICAVYDMELNKLTGSMQGSSI